ncbi:MAG: hypothetical protein WCC90_04500, partial [Methylocella sp.]
NTKETVGVDGQLKSASPTQGILIYLVQKSFLWTYRPNWYFTQTQTQERTVIRRAISPDVRKFGKLVDCSRLQPGDLLLSKI